MQTQISLMSSSKYLDEFTPIIHNHSQKAALEGTLQNSLYQKLPDTKTR